MKAFKLLFSILVLLMATSCVMGQYEAVVEGSGCKLTVAVDDTVVNSTTFTFTNVECPMRANITKVSITAVPPLFSSSRSPSEVCGSLGAVLMEHAVAGIEDNTNTTSSMGLTGLFHRGILLSVGDASICGTIKSTSGTIATHQAKLTGSIVGDLVLRTLPSVGTFVYADLYERDDVTEARTLSAVLAGNMDNIECPTESSGDQLVQFTPSVDKTSPRSLASDVISAQTDLDQKSVVIKEGDAIIACGKLFSVEKKVAKATIINLAELRLSQDSPFDATVAELDLTSVKSLPRSFQISEFPLLQRVDPSTAKCGSDSIGGVHDPFSGGDVGTTKDLIKIGDLKAKFRALTADDLGSKVNLGSDPFLPLFGCNSVVGRTFSIQLGASTECAAIHEDGVELTTALIRFHQKNVYGDMVMRQRKDQWYAETTFYAHLTYYDRTETSADHKYHVHVDPSPICGSTGGHYNPLSVTLGPDYGSWCGHDTPQRCEIGDLSNKHGKLTIKGILAGSSKRFYTDSFLPLSGPYSVLGRSIVVHDEDTGGPRFICADILPLHPVQLSTGEVWFKTDAADTEKLGVLTVRQDSQFDTASLSWSDSSTKDANFALHERSLGGTDDASKKCSSSIVGGVYDPFAVSTDLETSNSTLDRYKVGSLGKKGSVSRTKDSNLPLFTQLSVSNRAVLFRDSNCAQLKPVFGSNAVEAIANVSFLYEDFQGFLKMKQIIYDDGSTSTTSVEMKLFNPNDADAVSDGHNYHVHLNAVEKELTCDGIEGHFDPFATKTHSENYGESCSTVQQLACEVGDLSNKHGQAGLGFQFYNDDNLPLGGVNTILGRSIKIHGNADAPSVHRCATINPPEEDTYTICFPNTKDYDFTTFTEAISQQLSVNINRVIPLHNNQSPNDGGDDCDCLVVYIPGSVESTLVDMLLESNLAAYDSTGKCKSSRGSSGRNSSSTLKPTPALVLVCWFLMTLLR